MKMTFRYYGKNDPVTLTAISQIPTVRSIVSAIYDVPAGGVWSRESIAALKKDAADHGLSFEVVESVPVPEDIKLGNEKAPALIENYCENVRRLGEAGVKCICYNFMPVFDWLRTNLHTEAEDGSNALSYNHEELMGLDPHNLHLPGWDESYTSEELNSLLDAYSGMSHEQLFENLVYFLKGIMPACDETGINMAIHPDDPPWDMFGLPRIITGMDSYDKLFAAVPNAHNGITLCTGSLGAGRNNDMVEMASKLASRSYFVHLRQITHSGALDFCESGHLTEMGSLDMYGIVKALVEAGFDGYVRPDHGRNIWGEDGKPGYGLYDRALGATYLYGLFEAIEKGLK